MGWRFDPIDEAAIPEELYAQRRVEQRTPEWKKARQNYIPSSIAKNLRKVTNKTRMEIDESGVFRMHGKVCATDGNAAYWYLKDNFNGEFNPNKVVQEFVNLGSMAEQEIQDIFVRALTTKGITGKLPDTTRTRLWSFVEEEHGLTQSLHRAHETRSTDHEHMPYAPYIEGDEEMRCASRFRGMRTVWLDNVSLPDSRGVSNAKRDDEGLDEDCASDSIVQDTFAVVFTAEAWREREEHRAGGSTIETEPRPVCVTQAEYPARRELIAQEVAWGKAVATSGKSGEPHPAASDLGLWSSLKYPFYATSPDFLICKKEVTPETETETEVVVVEDEDEDEGDVIVVEKTEKKKEKLTPVEIKMKSYVAINGPTIPVKKLMAPYGGARKSKHGILPLESLFYMTQVDKSTGRFAVVEEHVQQICAQKNIVHEWGYGGESAFICLATPSMLFVDAVPRNPADWEILIDTFRPLAVAISKGKEGQVQVLRALKNATR